MFNALAGTLDKIRGIFNYNFWEYTLGWRDKPTKQ